MRIVAEQSYTEFGILVMLSHAHMDAATATALGIVLGAPACSDDLGISLVWSSSVHLGVFSLRPIGPVFSTPGVPGSWVGGNFSEPWSSPYQGLPTGKP